MRIHQCCHCPLPPPLPSLPLLNPRQKHTLATLFCFPDCFPVPPMLIAAYVFRVQIRQHPHPHTHLCQCHRACLLVSPCCLSDGGNIQLWAQADADTAPGCQATLTNVGLNLQGVLKGLGFSGTDLGFRVLNNVGGEHLCGGCVFNSLQTVTQACAPQENVLQNH